MIDITQVSPNECFKQYRKSLYMGFPLFICNEKSLALVSDNLKQENIFYIDNMVPDGEFLFVKDGPLKETIIDGMVERNEI